MSTTTIIEKFPAHRLEAAREALTKAHTRIVRAAAKTGQEAPVAPTLTIQAEHVCSQCQACKLVVEGFPPAGHACHHDGHAFWNTKAAWVSTCMLDLELIAARPILAGWDFLAVIEPLEGGNLIRQVPSAEVAEGELTRWRQGALVCDHCGTLRRRTETFIVRADGSDAAIAAGTYKQVGRNCLRAFLGDKDPAAILAQLTWPDIVRSAGDDGEGGWGGGQAARVFNPDVVLAQTAACIRLDGWVSRTTARQYEDNGQHVQATASQVMYLLTPPFGGDPRGEWRRECERCRPTDEDIAHGAAALAWARTLTPATDYERNLALIAQQPAVQHSHMGLLASAVSAYFRVLERELEHRRHTEAAARTPSRHVGEVGQRLDLELEVQRVTSVDTDYGALHIISMRDQDNNLFVWKTGSTSATPGDRLGVRGTVKKHDEYRGELQTILTRCTAAPIVFDHPLWPPPVAKKARRSKKVAPPNLDEILDKDCRAAQGSTAIGGTPAVDSNESANSNKDGCS